MILRILYIFIYLRLLNDVNNTFYKIMRYFKYIKIYLYNVNYEIKSCNFKNVKIKKIL